MRKAVSVDGGSLLAQRSLYLWAFEFPTVTHQSLDSTTRSMRADINFFLIASLTISTRAISVTIDCATGPQCSRASKVLRSCDGNGVTSAQLNQCVCTFDASWDNDIIDCVMCWTYPSATAYELTAALQYQTRISCGTPPNSSSNITSCTSMCRSVWQVGNSCGGYSSAEACTCKYRYIWVRISRTAPRASNSRATRCWPILSVSGKASAARPR